MPINVTLVIEKTEPVLEVSDGSSKTLIMGDSITAHYQIGGGISPDETTKLDAAYDHITSDGSDHGFVDQDVTTTGLPTFDALILDGNGYIDFDLTPSGIGQEGRVMWDSVAGTLAIGYPGGNVNLQVGQEGLIQVRNDSGSDIPNGKLVYTTGSFSQKPTIDLADKTDSNKIQILGMTTEDIDDDSFGYVAVWGKVRGDTVQPINTDGYAVGTKLFLSTAGNWTDVYPSVTEAVVIIGEVEREHQEQGIILISTISYFTLGNERDVTMRYSVINKSDGNLAATGFTAVNDLNHFMTVGIGGSNNLVFPDNAVFYGPGYNDNLYAVDGNKSHKWFNDPTDSHDNSSLDYLNMELSPNGDLTLPRGNLFSDNTDLVTSSGLETLENWVLYSADFTNGVWTTTNTTVTPETDYTTITQTSPAEAFISQDAISDTDEKLLTVLIVCKPVSVYKQNVKIVIEDSSGEIGSSEWILPLGEYTTIRVRATQESVSDVNLNFENPDIVGSFGLDIQKVQIFESLDVGIYNTGDSISLAAYDEITPPGIHPGQCYSMLYANAYGLELEQDAAGLSYLDDIKTRMTVDLPGNNYPIIMIEGGAVDVIFAAVSPVSDMLDDIREIVELARASTDTIALFTIPPMPVFTSEEATWAILYNIAITAEYADSETVTVINLSFLSADKFNFGTHVTLEGHVEIFEALDAAITIPYYSETYKFIETTDLANEEVYNQYSSDIHIDWTNTDKTIAGTAKWGGIASGGFGGDVPVYWTVESFSNGTIVDMPRLVPHGGGFTPLHGAMANLLYIHSDAGQNATLALVNNDFSIALNFIMNETTGALTFNGYGNTTWNDDFTINEHDLIFTGDSSGLPYGSMYNHDTSTNVDINAVGINVMVRIPSGFTVGQTNLSTFQNSREIVVTKAGRYKIDWSISFTSDAAAKEIEGSVMINNAIDIQSSAHRRINTGADTGNMGGTCILDLAASDVIALGVLNETAGGDLDVNIEHANLSFVMVGGT